jgi:hypothetical protein
MDPQQVRIRAKYMRHQEQAARVRRGTRWIGLTLGGTALAIYFYSMYMIKQETIMKEIDDEIERSMK